LIVLTGDEGLITVAEFAKDIGVTPKTVYKWLNRVKPEYGDSLTEKKGSRTYITEKGIEVLTASITVVKPSITEGKTEYNKVIPGETDEVLYLRVQNKVLLDELNKEREHSRSMTEQLAELARNSQVLLGAEQSRTNPVLLTGEDKTLSGNTDNPIDKDAPKKSLWERITGR